ncbi:hypothetical protein BpsS36_00031 [Bacillus phage vB_BpsS-36]|uniref:Uncharacterized protein n=1 Tax=Bacillus phage vB_BpsS-36 TaxID=2419622 RepID=A0A3G3BX39_9CAUD|nr:hypothetical protein BpsS36_00031 [Bacillus phage vB_BpsS-36]
MEAMELVRLYKTKAPASSLTDEQLKREVAWLLENDFTAESIFFSINYGSRYYHGELEVSLKNCLDNNRHEMIKYYQIARVKRAQKSLKESEEDYDQRNTFKGKDTPTWLRKSFDKHLFE